MMKPLGAFVIIVLVAIAAAVVAPAFFEFPNPQNTFQLNKKPQPPQDNGLWMVPFL